MISLHRRLLAGLLPLLWSSTMVLSQVQEPPPRQEHAEKQEAGGQERSEEQTGGVEGGEAGDDIDAHLEEAAVAEGSEVIEPLKEQDSGDDVTGKIKEAKEPDAGLWRRAPLSNLHQLWRPWRQQLSDDLGLDLGLAYTTLFQAATDGIEDPRYGWSGDFDIFGKWRLVNKAQKNTGSFGFLVEQRHRFTEIAPNDLGTNIGSLWGTTRGFNVQDVALAQWWWEQFLLDDRLKLSVGKLDPRNYYNGNRFQSQNTFFLNRAFSENPTRRFPRNSLGVNARLALTDHAYLSFGVHDTNGRKTNSGFGDLDKDDLFGAIEIGLTPRFEGLGRGRYRFTLWSTGGGDSSRGESGTGFALSFDQDLGNNLVPFLRYGYQDRDLRNTKNVISGGVGVLRPFGREADVLGVGLSWGDAEDGDLPDQFVGEVFYRLQATGKVQVTPGVQVIVDPSRNEEDDVVGVFSLRVRVVF